MTFESEIARLNEHFFFKEFTYSKNTFRPHPSTEFELADSIIWLGELAIIFQLKERNISSSTTTENEKTWFEKKVVTLATKQIRDSLAYLDTHQSIRLKNHRGHSFKLQPDAISILHKVICYHGHNNLPEHHKNKKFHRSSTAGIIHLIPANDYLGIVRTVLTPFELSEYLEFREELIEKWDSVISSVPEPALMGQFLTGNINQRPSREFIEVLESLEHNLEEWDLSNLIKLFPDRVTTSDKSTDYYAIVSELAKLKRNELREFKKRFQLSMKKCRSETLTIPYRMSSPRTQCAFVFIPLPTEMFSHRQQSLINLTLACKYDLKVPKCVGISFSPEEDAWFFAEWCYVEQPWEYNEELDIMLQQNNPFREVKIIALNRYDVTNH